jgi:hypothetical protein
MAGPGSQVTDGAGLHFIMDDGIMIIIMAGSGSLIMNGDLHGLHGGVETDITDGHRCDLE